MYGNVETPQSVKLAHEQLIREAAATFGSREAASDAFARRAWQLYKQDDLATAMRRFNEAWLLNPHNPQAYWGFGAILHDQGKVHEALAMLSRASELDPSNPRLMADLARVLAQEATYAATTAERERYFTKACEVFQNASVLDPKNGHSYGLWALALYDRGRYAEAWEKVHKAQELQAVIPEKFLRVLREKMPEPERP
jgi:Flp pilus assembly protein TadD